MVNPNPRCSEIVLRARIDPTGSMYIFDSPWRTDSTPRSASADSGSVSISGSSAIQPTVQSSGVADAVVAAASGQISCAQIMTLRRGNRPSKAFTRASRLLR